MTTSFTTVARGQGSRITAPRQVVVRDEPEWHALWALHAGPGDAAPAVDFTTDVVVGVFAGEKPSPGHEVEIERVRPDGAGVVVVLGDHVPAPGTVAAQMVVTPFHIVSLPRTGGPVRFTHVSRARSAGRSSDMSSSTGLRPNTAAALAYLAGPFSGVLLLMAERTNRRVRFHAYQSLLALGGLGLLAILLLAGAFLGLLVSPSAFTILYWLAFIAGAGWLVLWAVSLVMVLTGRHWRLPLIAPIAARRAKREG
jgi:uncharacterized membrane protein